MGKLDMQHEEMLAMLARKHERQRAAEKIARDQWRRDQTNVPPQEIDNSVRHLIRQDAFLRSK